MSIFPWKMFPPEKNIFIVVHSPPKEMQRLVQGHPCPKNGASGPSQEHEPCVLSPRFWNRKELILHLWLKFEGTTPANNIWHQWGHWPHSWGTGAPEPSVAFLLEGSVQTHIMHISTVFEVRLELYQNIFYGNLDICQRILIKLPSNVFKWTVVNECFAHRSLYYSAGLSSTVYLINSQSILQFQLRKLGCFLRLIDENIECV